MDCPLLCRAAIKSMSIENVNRNMVTTLFLQKIYGRPDVMWPVISFRISSLPNRPVSTEAVLTFDPLLIPI